MFYLKKQTRGQFLKHDFTPRGELNPRDWIWPPGVIAHSQGWLFTPRGDCSLPGVIVHSQGGFVTPRVGLFTPRGIVHSQGWLFTPRGHRTLSTVQKNGGVNRGSSPLAPRGQLLPRRPTSPLGFKNWSKKHFFQPDRSRKFSSFWKDAFFRQRQQDSARLSKSVWPDVTKSNSLGQFFSTVSLNNDYIS
jgi:hypothetical protein